MGVWIPYASGGGSAAWHNSGNPAGSARLNANNQTIAKITLTGDDLITLMGWEGVSSITINQLHYERYPEWQYIHLISRIVGNHINPGGVPEKDQWIEYHLPSEDETLFTLSGTLIEFYTGNRSSTYTADRVDNVRIVGRYD